MDYLLNNSVAKIPSSFEKYYLKTDNLKKAFSHPSFGEPETYKHCSFDNFICYDDSLKIAVDKLKEYERGCLSLLSERTGTGKTHLAIATAREYYRKKIFEWIDTNKDRDFGYKDYAEKEFFEMLEYHKPVFMTEFETYGVSYGNLEFKFYLPNRRLVNIDDIFASKNNEMARAALYEIVNTRVTNHNVPTIFTSNVLPENMIDNRVSSRLQSGTVYIISKAKDYRL